MQRLNPKKLHVTYLTGATPGKLIVPRRYTLTHSDTTGNLFLSIGGEHDTKQTSRLNTRLMRDEVLAELSRNIYNLVFRLYCHVSEGFVLGSAKFRYSIFHSELPLLLGAIRYGDSSIFEQEPMLDAVPVIIQFKSTGSRFNKVGNWGTMLQYR